ncbi:cleavage and polyadenylation specificity factor subunit 5 [Sporothrix schenckii 1099-18]|nr:cleavage and polyadenylation specificity factor subunit 5 [Sporothrix schenckii 1099-18]KJR80759.1 cleavage and polyadenylation specificity factor subunit 5 [Sporothrix schenckii 1099-18]
MASLLDADWLKWQPLPGSSHRLLLRTAYSARAVVFRLGVAVGGRSDETNPQRMCTDPGKYDRHPLSPATLRAKETNLAALVERIRRIDCQVYATPFCDCGFRDTDTDRTFTDGRLRTRGAALSPVRRSRRGRELKVIKADTQNQQENGIDQPRGLIMSTITKNAIQSGNPPIRPLPFDANQPETIRLYPLSNYTFGVKETQPEEDPSVVARLRRLEEHYAEHGMRRTCEGILVCHEHNHPHILMLQIANAFFKLPGDYLRPEDDELSGFKTRLDERLAPVGRLGEGEEAGDWEVGECLAQWWRPNFETFMYPFIPAHVTRPKECKKLYFIQLPKSKVLSVPKNMKLLAVPLFELYDNTARYGPQLSAIPHLLSRYNFEFYDEDGNVVAATPGGVNSAGVPPKTRVLAGNDDGDTDMKEENGGN